MSAVTIDDVFALFKEQERLMKEQSKEADRRAAEFTAQLKEQAKESARRAKEADTRSKEADTRSKEADERIKETERFLKEQSAGTEQKIKEVTKQIGDLGNRFGEWVEDLVAPAAIRLFVERGIKIKTMQRSVEVVRPPEAGGGGLEIDVLLVNGKEAVLIECKSRAAKKHVDDHIARLGKVREFLPHLAKVKLYGAIAAVSLHPSVRDYIVKKGMFVIEPSGDTVAVTNAVEFKPHGW